MLARVVEALRAEARRVNERRVIVVHGQRAGCYVAAARVIEAVDADRAATTVVGNRDILDCPRVAPRAADSLLGTTQDVVVLDWHDTCRPNALGQVVGTVDGGGLLVITAPPLDEWQTTTDSFHESLAVPPATVEAVGHRYHDRVRDLLYAHRGIAVVDVDTDTIECAGLTDPAPRRRPDPPTPPSDPTFTRAVYEAARTQDQVDAVADLEALSADGNAVVVEADRGRGKSSAAGLAAGALASEGLTVAVTAPDPDGTMPLFDRVVELLETLDALAAHEARDIRSESGGQVVYRDPETVLEEGCDVLLVDEAAGLPVARLRSYLSIGRVAFLTTVHGYEGAGRGFDVRFRDDLAASDHSVVDVSLSTPIRYADGDPVEVWAFHTLLLDAAPAVDPVVADATPEGTAFEIMAPDRLTDDERLLREAFGLLVAAHYRTEPNDLARLLDAPNLTVTALTRDGHVCSVALLAAEGGLDAETRDWMYDGGRIRGNMLPDVFASQLRDKAAAAPTGWRVLRIATHPSIRSRGLGSRLLECILDSARDRGLDWVGAGYGATADLVRFWAENDFSTVHLATTRSAESGEYSALMLHPLTEAGAAVHDRLASWFLDRIPAVLGDALSDADPDVVRAALAATRADPPIGLSPRAWRVVAGAAYGPGRYDVDPQPFQRLAVAALTDDAGGVTDREQRLLVMKVLQTRSWEAVTTELEYHSTGECMRALGAAYEKLCDTYGGPVVATERRRYED
ncbi:MAG: tRNA(Met) cytidine acetyltransferase TmcA [Halobacteriaceae archaeon]